MNKRFLSALLCMVMILSLCACGGNRKLSGYEIVAKLNDEQFTVAFRFGDPLCEIVSAALKEMASEGLVSRLSSQYLGADYSCVEPFAGALSELPSKEVLLARVVGSLQAPVAKLVYFLEALRKKEAGEE